MRMQPATLDSIDLSDEMFRISERLESPVMERSIREIGLQHPVLLAPRSDGRYRIVTGFRRLHAVARLGFEQVPARVAENLSPLEAIRLALWENLSHRDLDALEKARVLRLLDEIGGLSKEKLVEEYLPLLSLAPHKNILRTYLGLHSLHPALKRCFQGGELTLSSIERLRELSAAAQERMAAILQRARFSASRQRALFQLVEDLGRISEQSFEAVLSNLEIDSILEAA